MPIRWEEIERFARRTAERAGEVGGAVAPRFLAYDRFDDQGPAAVLGLEDPLQPAGEVVATCVALFAPLRPLRFAAIYPLVVEAAGRSVGSPCDDDRLHGLWIVRGEAAPPGAPRWTSTLLGYRRVGGEVVWAERRSERPVVPSDGVRAAGLGPILGSDHLHVAARHRDG